MDGALESVIRGLMKITCRAAPTSSPALTFESSRAFGDPGPCNSSFPGLLDVEPHVRQDALYEWFGHVNVSTTRLYDKRQHRPEDSPTFLVDY